VLAPLFFAVAGLRVELGALAVAIAGEFAGAAGGALLAGLPTRGALGVGAVLNARGAMEAIVATVGLQLGILTDGSYAVIVLVAIVTSAMVPPLVCRALGADRLRAAAGWRQ
jgi:Kef-type K+ transport system membrane component KefB